MNCCYVQKADSRLVSWFFVDEPVLLDLVIPLPFAIYIRRSWIELCCTIHVILLQSQGSGNSF